ncbi:MAG: GNAT family N-acetyltransferase [Ferruginibacter sp.]
MPVVFIPYKKIDKKKWDTCIENSLNSLLYARSFYLDKMAVNWDGLVLDDYEAVMPLTWKKKLQISYLYQPAFIQQGGVFSEKKITPEILRSFVDVTQQHFDFAEITFNYANPCSDFHKKARVSLRTNYIVELDKTYEELYENYDPSFTKSLRRLKKLQLQYEHSHDFTSIIQLYSNLYSKRLPYFTKVDFSNFEKICVELSASEKVITRLAYDQENELLAAAVLLNDGKRLYNIISCITPAGKKREANYFLYDKIICEFAGTGLILDMEGSDVKGIADFYMKLNPQVQPYPFVRYNELHPFIKLFKP